MASGSSSDHPEEATELHEGISLLEATAGLSISRPDGSTIALGHDANGNPKDGGVFDAKGRVPLHIIRPGIGRGRGRHLYEAQMLQEAAPNFSGWRMFVNHLSPEAKKAAAGLPRDVRDLGGRVQEAWWDGGVPANDNGHGQGAVVGMVRPVKAIRELIDDDPELIEASISASATGVRPVTRDGQRVWLVEGIQPRGSVDWVTEAGAGGRIAPLLQEAYADNEDVQEALLDSLTDDEIVRHLRSTRPALLQEAGAVEDGDTKEREALSESTDDPEGGDVAEITPEALSEALAASPNLLVEALTKSAEAQVFLASLVEAKLDEERDVLRAENKADVDRAFELAQLERTAHSMIAESKLPTSWQTDLRARYSLIENAPTSALDVVADVDDDGKTVKSAEDKLRESVEADIVRERERLREASATRVRSSAAPPEKKGKKDAPKDKKKGDDDGDDGDGGDGGLSESGEKPYWKQMLEEAGIQDPDKAYSIHG